MLALAHMQDIPRQFPDIDIALLHLGGTRVMGLYVTMDAAQGLELTRMIDADVTLPIHYNDYDAFKSPIEDYIKAVKEAGLEDKVFVLRHGDTYRFDLKRKALVKPDLFPLQAADQTAQMTPHRIIQT